MKTLEELMALADEYGDTFHNPSFHDDRSRLNRRFALASALRELIADAERPKLTWVGYQLQRLIGNPAVTTPFWTEWTACTKDQYEHAIATPDHQGRVLYASHDDLLDRP